MAERQVLGDAIHIGGIERAGLAETTTALRIFALGQVAIASMTEQYFAGAGDLKPLRNGLLSFDAFGTTHNLAFS